MKSGFSYLDYTKLLEISCKKSGSKLSHRKCVVFCQDPQISAFSSWRSRIKILAIIPSNLTKSALNA